MINSKNAFSHNNPNSIPDSREPAATSSETIPAFNQEAAHGQSEQERAAEQQLQIHKDQLTYALLYGPQTAIGTAQPPAVRDEERKIIYDNIKNDPGAMATQASRILQGIQMPSQKDGIHTVFRNNDSKYARRFLAIASQRPDTNENMASISAVNLSAFLESCPTPLEFDVQKDTFLKQMAKVNTPEKVAEYSQGLENFEANIYGKRYEYAQAYHELEHESAQHAAQQAYREQVVSSIHQHPSEAQIQAQQREAYEDSAAYWAPEMKGEDYHQPATPTPAPKKPGLFGKLFGKKK